MRAVVGTLLRGEDERCKKFRGQPRQVGLARGNANDGMRLAIERYRSTDDRWITTEAPSPEAVAEHDQARIARDISLREIGPENRRDLQRAEITRCDSCSTYTLRFTVGEVERCSCQRGRVLEHRALFGPVVEMADRGASLPELPPRFVHKNEAVAVGPGERTQQHCVHRAEDCDRCADAHRDSDDEHSGQERTDAQLAGRKAQVMSPVRPPLRSLHGSLPLFRQAPADGFHVLDVSEAAQRLLVSLFPRQTLREEFVDPRVDVKRELVVDVGPRIGSPEAKAAAPQRRGTHDTGCCFALNTRATAWAKLDQVVEFFCSRRRPSAVSR